MVPFKSTLRATGPKNLDASSGINRKRHFGKEMRRFDDESGGDRVEPIAVVRTVASCNSCSESRRRLAERRKIPWMEWSRERYVRERVTPLWYRRGTPKKDPAFG